MNPAYNNFLDHKLLETEERKALKAELTLKCYGMIEELLEQKGYDKFLLSIQDFIEKNEYVTEKQYEVVDRIYRHKDDEIQDD